MTRPTRRLPAGVATFLVASSLLSACLLEPGDPGTADVYFDVDASLDRHPISPYVYGSNVARELDRNRLGLVRLGGNRWTAYNWENNASNAGRDWCHQNDGYLSTSDEPGRAVLDVAGPVHEAGAALLVTVPIVDHVAEDKAGGSPPPSCSGDVRESGPDYLTTRFEENRARNPTPPLGDPVVGDGYVYQDEFVAWLTERVDGPLLFSLDNEPDLWAETHPEVHPAPVTYEELVARDVEFAEAVAATAPDAPVLGPVNYGYWGLETLQSAPDSGTHGNFASYWLSALAEEDDSAGRRLVDLFDLHWYPEARGDGVRITGTDTSPAVVAARLQAPRSLWDTSYVEDSWITRDHLHGPVALLPTLEARIDEHYPGTGIAVTEWNYGGGNHISGALATADVLGIFGREGVSAAALWELNADERYTYAGLRAFRNYDGRGGQFEDTSIRAVSSDVETATVYASIDAQDPTSMVIVAVNKSAASRVAGITVHHPLALSTAEVFTLTESGGPDLVPAGSIEPVDVNAFSYEMPARSVSVLVPRR